MKKHFLSILGLSRLHKQWLSATADFLLLLVSFYLASYVIGNSVFYIDLAPHAIGMACVTVAILYKFGVYRVFIRYANETALIILAAVVIAVSAVCALLASAITLAIPIKLYLCFAFIGIGLLAGLRAIFRQFIAFAGADIKENVLIYGAGAAGRQLVTALQASQEYLPVVIVDDDQTLAGTAVMGLMVYDSKNLPALIEKHAIKKVLLALPSASRSTRRGIIAKLQKCAVEIQTIPGMNDIIEGRMQVDNLRSVSVEDLLGREPVKAVDELITSNITGKNVLVTGAGGSIGSEICRQIIKQSPKSLVLYELSEFALYAIHAELTKQLSETDVQVELKPLLGTVQNKHRMLEAMKAFDIHTVYHAAAYKHVPMVEYNVIEGVRNNVFGTWHAAEAAIEAGVERFVLISTDKAVRPTNVMGTTKRCAELICQGLAERQQDTTITMVRFGNVLGSSGSVVPLFKRQIEANGPVTVTHRDITRYFMTIPEAAQLVIQAGAMAKGGEVYVLDMGEPVKIFDLAQHMIRLSGLSVKNENNPDGDIEIKFSGLRPGEKLYEELLIGDNAAGTSHPRINTALESHLPWHDTVQLIDALDDACKYYRHEEIRSLLLSAPTGFAPTDDIGDLVWLAAKRKPDNVVVL